LGNGGIGVEALGNDVGSGRRLIGAREVALEQLLVGDDVAELSVCRSPEVVHYLAGFFAEPVGVRLKVVALLKKGGVEFSG
jgi:hypothetical protein